MVSLSPPALTVVEQRAILRFTAGNVRDRFIFSLALGTSLLLAEITGLNVGDLLAPDSTPRVRIRIRAEIEKGGRAGDAFLPDRLLPKLKRFWRHRVTCGEGRRPDGPRFANRSRRPISKRRVPFAWRTWQRRAGCDRLYSFRVIRHSAVTNVHGASRDLFLAQSFAVSPVDVRAISETSAWALRDRRAW